jgi:hypothetical protein
VPKNASVDVTDACELCRGGKTAIAFFVAGVRGWESGLRRRLDPPAIMVEIGLEKTKKSAPLVRL